MTTTVCSVPSETPVAEVATTMVRGRFGSVLVTTSDMLIGILTERDVLRAAASGKDLTQSPASAWMTKDPETVTADIDSDEAAQIMLTQGFRHLPVVDGNTILGIVSLRDVLATRIGRAI
jgi:CBS domain-containing protein